MIVYTNVQCKELKIVSIHIHYQTTGRTARQKTTTGQFLSSCAAEHVAAASV